MNFQLRECNVKVPTYLLNERIKRLDYILREKGYTLITQFYMIKKGDILKSSF